MTPDKNKRHSAVLTANVIFELNQYVMAALLAESRNTCYTKYRK